MATIPEFILRKLFVKGSLIQQDNGFSFAIHNTFAPAAITGFRLEVNGSPVPAEQIVLEAEGSEPCRAEGISSENHFPLPVNTRITVQITGQPVGAGNIKITVDTVEAGILSFIINALNDDKPAQAAAPKKKRTWSLPAFLQGPLRAVVRINNGEEIGEIRPEIYGQFVEHLERCVYGGIWSADGASVRPDTLRLIQAIKPPIIRYPGGNFASGYHWEDGIGPKDQRAVRTDHAWKAQESNQVGTDEFIQFCRTVNAEPFLVVNDATGTAEEAARWVAYCNEPPDGEQGRRRAANGHPEPYHVRYWGVGNEVWGAWQIGHTGAEGYAARIRPIIAAMRAVDPEIKIVAVGQELRDDAVNNAGHKWNEAVLKAVGGQIDYLSFHLYQPGQSGWKEAYDLQDLHLAVCAAPLSAEKMIVRMGEQIRKTVPQHRIRVALDEWNLWLSPPEGAASMHQVRYCMRDALYIGGMLNAFQRQCRTLEIANLAQLVNVLPLIVTDESQAYATSIYYPFLLFKQTEKIALKTEVESPTYSVPEFGEVEAMDKVPYIDVAATTNRSGTRLVLSVVNRHPERRVDLSVRLSGFFEISPKQGWLLTKKDSLAFNSFEAPETIKAKEITLPSIGNRNRFTLDLPPASLSIIALESS